MLDDGDLLTDRERVGKAALTHEASKLVKGAHEALRDVHRNVRAVGA